MKQDARIGNWTALILLVLVITAVIVALIPAMVTYWGDPILAVVLLVAIPAGTLVVGSALWFAFKLLDWMSDF